MKSISTLDVTQFTAKRYCDDFDHDLSDGGQCFRTKEDAQKWIQFMKSMME